MASVSPMIYFANQGKLAFKLSRTFSTWGVVVSNGISMVVVRSSYVESNAPVSVASVLATSKTRTKTI